MKHTDEQLEIIEASRTSKSLVVNALAGTGKTSTALACARANPKERIVYLCFNKANADEMKRKCEMGGIRNVRPSTLHSLAYRAQGMPLVRNGRQVGSLKPFHIAGICALRDRKGNPIDGQAAMNRANKLLLENLSDYCHSSAKSFAEFKKLPMYKPRLWQLDNLHIEPRLFQRETERLWNAILERSDLLLPHDVYMKLFHLRLDSWLDSSGDTMVVVDEAQDLFPVTEDIVKRMRDSGMRALFLGDRYQQIYSWNKSVNAMEHFEEGSDRLMLTQSFRCPAEVVEHAQPWLKLLGFPADLRPAPETDAADRSTVVISRSNAGVFGTVSALLDGGYPPEEIAFVGGAKGYCFDILEDRLHFVRGEMDRIKFPPMGKLKDDDEYDAYAKSTKDIEMQQAKWYIETLGGEKVSRFLRLVKSDAFSDGHDAAISVSTGHKVKGLEFGRVLIGDSFVDILEAWQEFQEDLAARKSLPKDEKVVCGHEMSDDRDMASKELEEVGDPDSMKLNAEELRLAYVALTRSLSEIQPGKLDLVSTGAYEQVRELIEAGKIELVDRDQQGNIRLYGKEDGKPKAGGAKRKRKKAKEAQK